MASRENLIPTVTVAKSGEQTTVYRKTTRRGMGASPIPAPVTPLTPARREEISTAIIYRMDDWGRSEEACVAVEYALKSYPDHTLEMVDQARVNKEKGFPFIVDTIIRGESPDDVSEQLYFYNELTGNFSYYTARYLVDSVHHYPQLPESKDYSKESEEVRSQCLALMKFEQACMNIDQDDIFNTSIGEFVLADKKLIELVISNVDKVDLMTTFVRSHRSLDIGLLAELVNGDSNALGNGRL